MELILIYAVLGSCLYQVTRLAAGVLIDIWENRKRQKAYDASVAENKRWNALTHLGQLEEELAELEKT